MATVEAVGEERNGGEIKEGVAWVGRRLKRVEYTTVDGQAVVEGCIVLGEVAEIEQLTQEVDRSFATDDATPDLETFGVGVHPQFLWPNKTVPFSFAAGFTGPERVMQAIEHWRQHTPLRFLERTQANRHLFRNWITFRNGGGCSSMVGCRGGEQFITLGAECSKGNVIHEIGHAVGLFHEQSREDRNRFVKIHMDRVAPQFRHNFSQHIVDANDFGPYDFGSIMHYPANAFGGGQVTIEAIGGATIGQRVGLSAGDKATIRLMYG